MLLNCTPIVSTSPTTITTTARMVSLSVAMLKVLQGEWEMGWANRNRSKLISCFTLPQIQYKFVLWSTPIALYVCQCVLGIGELLADQNLQAIKTKRKKTPRLVRVRGQMHRHKTIKRLKCNESTHTHKQFTTNYTPRR